MAYVLSSVSGNLISAASAGYAPTNSADVSAIASAYQVVSATATQIYAGTSYLTGVNEAPISAERAGQAANASLANSAYYDGTGRLISSLPDSAAVSAIASAYAEAAASSKLDSTAFNSGDFYSTSNPSGFITGVDLSNYATTGYVDSSVSSKLDSTAFNSGDFYSTSNPSGFITGVDLGGYATTAYVDSSLSSKLDTTAFNSADFYTTANESGFVGSAYVDSAVSGKQDQLTFSYDDDKISAINGSALAGQGGGGGGGGIDSATCSAIASAYAESAVSSVSGDYYPMTGNPSSFALSSDVSGTVDLVSTQSANWGGSALALSAGPGVTLTKSGDTLVAGLDETVIWENTAGQVLSQGISLSESRLNFEILRFYMASQIGKSVIIYDMPMYGLNRTTAFAIQPSMPFMDTAGTGYAINWQIAITATDSAMASVQSLYWGKNNFGSANSASGSWMQGNNNTGVPAVYKVIGINRTAGV